MKWLHKDIRRLNKRQKILSKLVNKRTRVFAWKPITTNTQIVVWLDYVWRDDFVIEEAGKFISVTTIYYLTMREHLGAVRNIKEEIK